MRFHLNGRWVDRPCFWNEGGGIHLIDQRKLPSRTIVIEARTLDQQVEAIKTLAVRGAPSIGVFGAHSLGLAIERGEDPNKTYGSLLSSRPTAVDLRNCMDEVMKANSEGGSDAAIKAAFDVERRTIASCRAIGERGVHLIPDKGRVLTHCNAGALATLDWGTALSPIRMKARGGGSPFVWVSETRPLLQGSRLTAWELENEGIDHSIIVDSASGHIMKEGYVDLVIVGADRVAMNGDIANKIGTLEKAIMAREFDIPFYVAFPSTTLDTGCPDGGSIPIEERSQDEIRKFEGCYISPEGSKAFGPAFDVTPAELITGYITENGMLSVSELSE